jgi:hypothetical protein
VESLQSVHPRLHSDGRDESVRRTSVGTPRRRARLRARTRVNNTLRSDAGGSALLTLVTLFQNCVTLKTVN